MPTSAGIARTPYLLTVSARICQCDQPPKELGRHKRLARAIEHIEGYWNVYLGFFGDQQIWLTWLVVDTRDGQLMWRNGHQLAQEEGDSESHNERTDSASAWAQQPGRR